MPKGRPHFHYFSAGSSTPPNAESEKVGEGCAVIQGVALCIIAALCAEIQNQAGHFLQISYDSALAGL